MNNFIPNEKILVIPWWLDCREPAEELLIAYSPVTAYDSTIFEHLLGFDDRHEKGCQRRYGAVFNKWVPHEDCPCHAKDGES